MRGRWEVSDGEWSVLEPILQPARRKDGRGRPWQDTRAVLNGVLWVLKKVPGRKTDVKDAEWIADLVCHGLLRSSFVPPKAIRELRDLGGAQSSVETLESANIKLASVASDVFGTSGRLMLRALIAGKATPQEMAELAQRKLRSKIPQLQLALEGKEMTTFVQKQLFRTED